MKACFHIKKRHAILIEVIIALALMSVIMSLLLIFYKDLSNLSVQQEKEDESNFQQLYLTTRLAAILPKALAFGDSAADYFFFTSHTVAAKDGSGSSLVFAFDNGVKLNPDLSNHVIGRLYINKQAQFCLATCPSPARWNEFEPLQIEQEVLLENVREMKLEFYVPAAKDRKQILSNNKTKFEINPNLVMDLQGTWRSEWQQEYGDLPALVRIILTLEDEKNKANSQNSISLYYPLPNSHLIIVYDR